MTSYVGGPFKTDFFVSYGHASNKKKPSKSSFKLRDWSRDVVQHIQEEFTDAFGIDLAVFIDTEIDQMRPLSAQLSDEAKHSAVLMVIMSPHYLQSGYCRDELHEWISANRDGPGSRIPWNERIAVIRAFVTEQAWPDELRPDGEHLIGFDMYEMTTGGYTVPLGWNRPTNARGVHFNKRIQAVVGCLKNRLQEIRRILSDAEEYRDNAMSLIENSTLRVYLHARLEDSLLWQRAADRLQSEGFVVIGRPAEAPPDRIALQRQSIARMVELSSCDALLILGREPMKLDDDMSSIGRHERQRVRSLTNKPLPCALLNSARSASDDPTRRQRARLLQIQWFDEVASDWTLDLKTWLEEIGRRESDG